MLTRNCPVCQVEIVYKTKQSLNVANKGNKRCRKCGGAETSEKLKGRDRSDEHKTRISEGKKGHSWIAMLERKYGKERAEEMLRNHAETSRERSLRANPMKGKNWKEIVRLKNGEEANDVLARHALCSKNANGMQGKSVYQVWEEKYGVEMANEKMSVLKSKRSENAKGRDNPMWGKSAPIGSGGGWSGWYNGIYFRSLLELSFMLQLEAESVQYVSAECGRFRVKYSYQNKECTYYPDFYLPEENVVVELKPLQRTQEGRFLAKQEAASKVFNYRVVTDANVKTIGQSKLLELVQSGIVTLLPKWAHRLGERT